MNTINFVFSTQFKSFFYAVSCVVLSTESHERIRFIKIKYFLQKIRKKPRSTQRVFSKDRKCSQFSQLQPCRKCKSRLCCALPAQNARGDVESAVGASACPSASFWSNVGHEKTSWGACCCFPPMRLWESIGMIAIFDQGGGDFAYSWIIAAMSIYLQFPEAPEEARSLGNAMWQEEGVAGPQRDQRDCEHKLK